MISISMILADTDGNIIIDEAPNSEYRNGPGRVTRTANLDGSTTINHGGVQDGDRSFKVFGSLTSAEVTTMWYIFQNSTLVTVCTPDGAYKGAIDFLDVNGGNLDLSLLIKERISE